jgi:hypothetical protein
LRWLVVGFLVTAVGHKKSSARSLSVAARYRSRVDSARVQTQASNLLARLWQPHDPGRPRLLHTIGRHATNQTFRENAGALPLLVSWGGGL